MYYCAKFTQDRRGDEGCVLVRSPALQQRQLWKRKGDQRQDERRMEAKDGREGEGRIDGWVRR